MTLTSDTKLCIGVIVTVILIIGTIIGVRKYNQWSNARNLKDFQEKYFWEGTFYGGLSSDEREYLKETDPDTARSYSYLFHKEYGVYATAKQKAFNKRAIEEGRTVPTYTKYGDELSSMTDTVLIALYFLVFPFTILMFFFGLEDAAKEEFQLRVHFAIWGVWAPLIAVFLIWGVYWHHTTLWKCWPAEKEGYEYLKRIGWACGIWTIVSQYTVTLLEFIGVTRIKEAIRKREQTGGWKLTSWEEEKKKHGW